MEPEEFKAIYEDTHTELQMLEHMRNNGSLIKDEPGSKNITKYGKIPGKALIESIEMDKRAEGLSHCVLDACGVRVGDLMEIPAEKLFSLAVKLVPQKIDQKIEGNFTLVNLIQKAHTVDAE